MLIETIAAAALVALAAGGKLINLGRLEFRYFYLIIAAFAIQSVIDYRAGGYQFWVYPYLHLLSYFILFFVLFQNRRLPGMYLIIIGTMLNFIVIALNGGQMPVSPDALPADLRQALATGHGGTHSLITGNTRMEYLADIFHIVYFNHNQLVSIGDLVMNIGVFLLVFMGMKRSGESKVKSES